MLFDLSVDDCCSCFSSLWDTPSVDDRTDVETKERLMVIYLFIAIFIIIYNVHLLFYIFLGFVLLKLCSGYSCSVLPTGPKNSEPKNSE